MTSTESTHMWQPSTGSPAEPVAAPIVRPGSAPRSVGFEGSPSSAQVAETQSEHSTPVAIAGSANEPPVASAPVRPVNAPTGPPLAKRPKGRLFVGGILLGTMLLVASQVWQTWFHYQCFGVVTGQVIQVAAPWSGNIRSVHHREGDLIRQGELVITMDSPDLAQRLARVGDEMRIAQATLSSQLSQMQWDAQLRESERRKALAEYYALWGQVVQEEARQQELEQKVSRLSALTDSGAVAEETLDEARWNERGQREKVAKLRHALQELKQRAELDGPNEQVASKQLQPHLLRLETLCEELQRLRALMERGYIRAPVDGRLTQRLRFVGEYATASTPVMEMLELGSLEVVLYVPQSEVHPFAVGHILHVDIDPLSTPVCCRVKRLGVVMLGPPEGIQQHYRRDQKLVPVHLAPELDPSSEDLVRLGTKVKLPRFQGVAGYLHGILK